MEQNEKSTRDKIEETRLEKERLRLSSEKNQPLIELSRYKQDCRKKSLELAHYEYLNASGLKPDETALTIADRYYEWLTKEV